MSNAKEFFLSVTQRIFSNWTALRMAVEYGMGSKESAIDFCPYMTEVMYMNELQDDSAVQVAEELLRFYRYCIGNNENLAMAEFEKLPPLQSWFSTTEPVRRTHNPVVENDSSEEEETSKNVEVADEWTEVRSRRKR
ncbi:uncharacterized protein LOC143186156 isoform X2 [Calliopsis andreniformis]|uniref:uncharacterized protein LOC143186156 isoform X2 n=1 Tax=Calliopsis andreniformis TaxID=337506 RepID=UPI003FCE02B6